MAKTFKTYSLSNQSRFCLPFLVLHMSMQYSSFKLSILSIGRFFYKCRVQYQCKIIVTSDKCTINVTGILSLPTWPPHALTLHQTGDDLGLSCRGTSSTSTERSCLSAVPTATTRRQSLLLTSFSPTKGLLWSVRVRANQSSPVWGGLAEKALAYCSAQGNHFGPASRRYEAGAAGVLPKHRRCAKVQSSCTGEHSSPWSHTPVLLLKSGGLNTAALTAQGSPAPPARCPALADASTMRCDEQQGTHSLLLILSACVSCDRCSSKCWCVCRGLMVRYFFVFICTSGQCCYLCLVSSSRNQTQS